MVTDWSMEDDLGFLGPNVPVPERDRWQEVQAKVAHQARLLGRQVPIMRARIPFGTSRSAWIALGSSIGDRPRYLRRAIQEIAAISGLRLRACSPVYQTDPVGFAGRDFYNVVLHVLINLSPLQLLEHLQHIELQLGRVRHDGWAARTIDIDILSIDGITVDIPGLILPHPRLLERQFVLVPWLDLDPSPLPNGMSVQYAHNLLNAKDPDQLLAIHKLGGLRGLVDNDMVDNDLVDNDLDQGGQ